MGGTTSCLNWTGGCASCPCCVLDSAVPRRDWRELGLEACGGDREVFSREDEAFHLALAECTRNPLMVWLYRRINNVRGHKQWNAMKDTVLSRERIEEYNRQHRALYEALSSRDIDGALEIIGAHLERARRDLLGAGLGPRDADD